MIRFLLLMCFCIHTLFPSFVFAEPKQVVIPAGDFLMGCSAKDELCDNDEGPEGGVKVFVPAFAIDVHETSVSEYTACVEAGECNKPFDYKRSHYCNYDAPGRGNYPLNCVNWENAKAYCSYRGARLAYEAEWEKAARGNTNTPYFWGYKPASCSVAVIDPGTFREPDTSTDGCYRDLSWARGSFPANPYGLYDMIGGTSEWVENWYSENAYEALYAKGDITAPAKGIHKTIKGGSWDEKHWAHRVSNRFSKPVTGNPDLYGSNGIRCVTPVLLE